MHIKVDQNKTKVDLNSLAICKEIAKIDADKLSQREVSFIGRVILMIYVYITTSYLTLLSFLT